jgi:hypothetical protein
MKKILVGLLCLLFLFPLGMQAASIVHKYYDVEILNNLTVDNTLTADNVVAGAAVIDNLSITGAVTGAAVSAHRGVLTYLPASYFEISTTSCTAIQFTGENYDTDNMHSVTTDNTNIQVPTGVTKVRLYGKVMIGDSGSIDNNIISLDIRKNTSIAYAGLGRVSSKSFYQNNIEMEVITPVLSVAAGDKFALYVCQNENNSLVVHGNAAGSYTWFAMDIVQ